MTFESDTDLKLSGIIYAPDQVTRIHSGTTGYSNPYGGGIAIITDFLEVTSSATGLYVNNDFSLFGDEPLFREARFLE